VGRDDEVVDDARPPARPGSSTAPPHRTSRPSRPRGSDRPRPPRPRRRAAASASSPATSEISIAGGRVVRCQHRPPGRGERQSAGVELREEAQRVTWSAAARPSARSRRRGSRGWRARRATPPDGARPSRGSSRRPAGTWAQDRPRGPSGRGSSRPGRASQTANPPVSAWVVIQMSIPNRLTSGRPVVLRQVVPDERSPETPKSPPIGCRIAGR